MAFSLVPRLSVGGKRESLGIHCLRMSQKTWESETIILYLYIHDSITNTYSYIVCTFSD